MVISITITIIIIINMIIINIIIIILDVSLSSLLILPPFGSLRAPREASGGAGRGGAPREAPGAGPSGGVRYDYDHTSSKVYINLHDSSNNLSYD